ncbi:DUF2850 domain-containing protein [Vibrio panuliri]|uniref:DUF2850 domain-containing protein n=1 Tax=Vibrio panuliri TaxID=1381081 RepID=A0A1Q9HNB3_9VIBR|nr:DUF2850 domain-containing protein [Vibrio panuliri]KAB1457790.1 DUF2850 domain-containing protein [Vibrio panuliri]OLQ85727.1 hypothetical protein BIY20_02755 [Vibrio panuliri]OLQ92280.1 hypothetical protein BIY22_15820 [Vibrio panuliri]
MAMYFRRQSTRSKASLTLHAIRYTLFAVAITTVGALSVLIYQNYQQSIDPHRVYGRWIEIGTPTYDRATIEFNQDGVFRNNRLITTKFEFDGSQIRLETGSGWHVYQLSSRQNAPLLNRVQPNSPSQRFVKQGYEHLVDLEGGGLGKKRRSAIVEHFNEK